MGLPIIYAWHGCLGKCGTSCRCLRCEGNIIKTLRRRKDSVQFRFMVDDSTQRMILFFFHFFFNIYFGLLGGAMVSIEMNENHENPDSDIKIVVL